MNKTDIDQVADYIAALDPNFAPRIQPATPDEIAELESVTQGSGAVVPPTYRAFLERMGHGLEMPRLPNANYDIQAVIARYRFGYIPPPGFWMIGRAKGDPYFDVYLHSPTGAESRIMMFPPPPLTGFAEFARKNVSMLAGNLAQWLGCAAFEAARYPQLPESWIKSSKGLGERRLAACDAALTSCGFTALWFSDDWKRVYEGPQGVALAVEFPGGFTVVLLRARTRDTLVPWTARVEQALESP